MHRGHHLFLLFPDQICAFRARITFTCVISNDIPTFLQIPCHHFCFRTFSSYNAHWHVSCFSLPCISTSRYCVTEKCGERDAGARGKPTLNGSNFPPPPFQVQTRNIPPPKAMYLRGTCRPLGHMATDRTCEER